MENNTPLECDILVIGGGTAGMMAAIYGAEAGASVLLAEKGNTRRSGAGATGNDHFQCYIPEIHGTEEEWMNLFVHDRPGGRDKDMNLNTAFMRGSLEVVKDWEAWGIPMRPHGYWEFTGHTLPWIKGTHLKYAGVNQKPVFTREALKRGVRILNRHPAADVLLDESGAVCGAILLDLTHEAARLQVVRCKSVVLCTARPGFVNPSDRMGDIFNSASPYTNTGDGSAIAWRCGVKLLGYGVSGSMRPGAIGASTFFNRGGTRTWVGVYTDINGKPYAPFGEKTTYDVLNPGVPGESHTITYPHYDTGEYTQYLPENQMNKAYAKGQPVFMNFSFNDEEDTEYMKWALIHEGNSATLDHLKAEGFDFKKHMLEFRGEMSGGVYAGGPEVNERGETNVKGFYAAGECTGNHLPGLSPAAVLGRDAGRAAAAYSRTVPIQQAENSPLVAKRRAHFEKLLSNPAGPASPTYKEANIAIMQIVGSYGASGACSEELFEVGLQHLRRLQKKLDTLQAQTPHQLMNCIAVENIAVNAELALMAGRERKETRRGGGPFGGGCVNYVDYPEIDHRYDHAYTTLQLVDGEPVFGVRKIITSAE